ncbi:hypothetical protein BCIN_02g02770 [Botrytis cinerea B05.10]|uniref:Uncharacterized protein n=1 Tax=Botryotinia fuckeliana (strain B05.10) TaxID=332648 RepID=A0A384J8H4_BOTFB|nr:hypothetical protein BCIN_02g02770 [Botrytis cinerea B05.10]ATZ46935.1 hypothetical protein BCIN_02g02770 [Botrytis cinerea B05.10]
MTETSGSIKEGKEGRMGKIIGSKASGNREKEEIKQGWLRVGEQAYAWWNKSAEERAIITEKQRATRKERFVKNGRLPEIKRRQGERYRATVAAKTEEERRAPIEMQKAWLAGRTPFLSHSALPPLPPSRPAARRRRRLLTTTTPLPSHPSFLPQSFRLLLSHNQRRKN